MAQSDTSAGDSVSPPSPDISLLSHAAGRHSQHFFATVLQSNAFHVLVNDHTLDLTVRSRIRQCSQEGAGRFMGVVAGRSKDLQLTNDDYLVNFWHRFGLPQRLLQLPTARCGPKCSTHGPGCAFDPDEFASGAHVLSCKSLAQRYARHQAVLGYQLGWLKDALGASVSKDHVACHVDDNDRIDAIVGLPYAQKGGAQTIGLDSTVTCAAVPTLVCARATQHSAYATDEAESRKAAKHRAHCAAGNMDYETGAMSTYGGWGGGFLGRFVKPHYRRMKAEEIAEGGTGHEAVAAKRRFLERGAIIMARCNAAMVAAASMAP